MSYFAYLIVFIGAGVGGALRHGVNIGAARLFGTGLPWGTLTVNVVGSLLMGLITEYWTVRSGLPQPLRLFLTTGILGGFTTFSAFSMDAATLWDRGTSGAAAVYVVGSVVAAITAFYLGALVARQVLS